MKRLLANLSMAALLLVAVPVSAATLTAGYAGGNYNDGIMFDLVMERAISLDALSIHADVGTFDYRVYYRVGGLAGFQNDADAWTLAGSFEGVTTAGAGSATVLDLTDLLLSSGHYGFYVTDGGAFSVQYSNSASSSGSTQVDEDGLRLLVGYGVSGDFGPTVADRAFNGALTYTAAVPEPSQWVMMVLGFGVAAYGLRRRKALSAESITPRTVI